MTTNEMTRYHGNSSELKEDFLRTFHNLQKVVPSHHITIVSQKEPNNFRQF